MQKQRVGFESGGQAQKEKIEYIPVTKSPANATDDQKESVRLWNLMVKTIRDNGLMKEK
jgi:hypothetical protein